MSKFNLKSALSAKAKLLAAGLYDAGTEQAAEEFSSSGTINLVINAPSKDELIDWRKSYTSLGSFIGTSLMAGGASGWFCFIAEASQISEFNDFFTASELADRLEDLAGKAAGKAVEAWMRSSHCAYGAEGMLEFYGVSSKEEAIKLLKACPYVKDIYEIDDAGAIIKIW